jgi:hypothetical protein
LPPANSGIEVADKLISKHAVETGEVEDALTGTPKIRFVEKGDREGENVYLALGQTDSGRYLAIDVKKKI